MNISEIIILIKSIFSHILICIFFLYIRCDRNVEIRHEKNITAAFKNSLIQAMHDALDHIGQYPVTPESLAILRDWMTEHMEEKYHKQKWSVIVKYRSPYAFSFVNHSNLFVVIGKTMFILLANA